MTSDRWKVRVCPEGHALVLVESHQLACPYCYRDLSAPFEVMRVPDLEGAGQARSTDPRTARAAAEIKVTRGSQRWKVLEAIREAGAHGATSHELEDLTGIRYASLTPRIGELKRGCLIIATERTRTGKYGVAQEVLIIKPAERPLRASQPASYQDPDDYPVAWDEPQLF